MQINAVLIKKIFSLCIDYLCMDSFKTMDPLGQTPPKDLLSNADGQNPASAPATTPVSSQQGWRGVPLVIKTSRWFRLVGIGEKECGGLNEKTTC